MKNKRVLKRDIKNIFPKEFTNRELIGKFFDYVVNNFFEKSSEEYINGFIGRKTIEYNEYDNYITEKTKERELFQLTPMIVSGDNVIDYKNLINRLTMQGCLTNKLDRLLNQKYWSWCPPINIDMFINYNFYYWIEKGVDPYIIDATTNVVLNVLEKEHAILEYTENNATRQLELKNGLRIKLLNDENTEYNNKTYIVDGVGTSIQLLLDDNIAYSKDSEPDYCIMERGCLDENMWSLRNRWFHKSVITDFDDKLVYVITDDSGLLFYTDVSEIDSMHKDFYVYTDEEMTQRYFLFSMLVNPKYTKQTVTLTLKQATKPIICFNKNIQLYNHGIQGRGSVDLLVHMEKNKLNGSDIHNIQGIELKDGLKILLIDEKNQSNSNIYEITGRESSKCNILKVYTNGKSIHEEPLEYDSVRILYGDYKNKNYYYKNGLWNEGQNKIGSNQPPLFQLYDIKGTPLDDELYYPHSSFHGSKIFEYDYIEKDTMKIENVSSYGNYVFNNVLETDIHTYILYNEKKEIKGLKFYKNNITNDLLSDWNLCKENNQQMVITNIVLNGSEKKIYTNINDVEHISTLVSLEVNPKIIETKKSSFVYLNGKLMDSSLYEMGDYSITFNNIELKENDNLFIKTYIETMDNLPSGYFYDVPYSLSSNPMNKNINQITYNECFDQMVSIMQNQYGFRGNIIGDNNYNETKQDLSLGTDILQHSSPIIKTMLLNNDEMTDVRNVIEYVKNEYLKFKSKFKLVIENMSTSGEYNEYEETLQFDINGSVSSYVVPTDVYKVIKNALNKINLGKEGLNPFFNNGVANVFGECYIPSTPSYLGLDTLYEPKIIELDSSTSVLLCHDGSYLTLFNDYRDNALLTLETEIYKSCQTKNNLSSLTKYNYIPGKFRETEYTREEFIRIMSSFFELWCMDNNVDYTKNDIYDRNNPLTWNWSSCVDISGEQLHGNYRAIYEYYYDTYRPHTHPWEMLGFGEQPTWWDSFYGKAPYTSNNIPMWKDIENGYIASGELKGEYNQFKRKGLVEKYLPVDSLGNLLNPYQIGITNSEPLSYHADDNWNIGDMGNIEMIWKKTSEYKFSLQTMLYLMKPISWIEENWDVLNYQHVLLNQKGEQIINTDMGKRNQSNSGYIHNEYVDGAYLQKIGIQQWFSDYLTNEKIDITNRLGNVIRNSSIQMGNKCGRFYEKDSLDISTDNYGLLSHKDFSLKLYKSNSNTIKSYSAILVTKTSDGYIIDGFDKEKSYFEILLPEYSLKKTIVECNNRNFTYYNSYTSEIKRVKYKTLYKTLQEVYTFVNAYGKYLIDVEGWEFLTLDGNGEIIDFRNKSQDLLEWGTNDVENNTFILINPGADKLRIKHDGMIDKVGQSINGYWSILDSSYNPIYNSDIEVYRHDGYTDVSSKTKYMTCLKITNNYYEHVILINNVSIYGYILYDSLKNTKFKRLNVKGISTKEWDGTLSTPGYLLTNDGLINNYDKMVDDFRYYYDTDNIKSFNNFGNEAKRTIGFTETEYMKKLLVDDRNIFDFYKGLLKEKGTRKSFVKLNRSKYIMDAEDMDIELHENWAFKAGEFGNVYNDYAMEFLIQPEKIISNPQIVSFTTSNDIDINKNSYQITWDSDNWLKKRSNKDDNTFMYSDKDNIQRDTSYVLLDDVNYIVSDVNELDVIKDTLKENDTILVTNYDKRGWNVINYNNGNHKSYRFNDVMELTTINSSMLTVGDIIYIDKVNLNKDYNKFLSSTSLSSDKFIVDKNCWGVFKYNGLKGYSNIVSSPNGIIEKVNDNTLKINKGLEVYLCDGLDDHDTDIGIKTKYYYEIRTVLPTVDISEYLNDENSVFRNLPIRRMGIKRPNNDSVIGRDDDDLIINQPSNNPNNVYPGDGPTNVDLSILRGSENLYRGVSVSDIGLDTSNDNPIIDGVSKPIITLVDNDFNTVFAEDVVLYHDVYFAVSNNLNNYDSVSDEYIENLWNELKEKNIKPTTTDAIQIITKKSYISTNRPIPGVASKYTKIDGKWYLKHEVESDIVLHPTIATKYISLTEYNEIILSAHLFLNNPKETDICVVNDILYKEDEHLTYIYDGIEWVQKRLSVLTEIEVQGYNTNIEENIEYIPCSGNNGYSNVGQYPEDGMILSQTNNSVTFNNNVPILFANGVQSDISEVFDETVVKLNAQPHRYFNRYFYYYELPFIQTIDNLEEDDRYIVIDYNNKLFASKKLYVGTYIQGTQFNENDLWYCDSGINENRMYRYINGQWLRTWVTILAEKKAEIETSITNIISIKPYYPFTLERLKEKNINMDIIDRCYMVNNDTDVTMSEIYLYDPLQGIFPKNVIKDIDYITAHDPVDYSKSIEWSDEKIGKLWWDISKVHYIDYKQGSMIYKRDNWGKQLPGSEIAIMEWTKSNVLPDNIIHYIEKMEYNYTTMTFEKYYYYWVKNPITIPMGVHRDVSAFYISNIINSPSDMGVIWVSPIDINVGYNNVSSFIISNFDNVATSDNFVIQFNFKNSMDVNEHEEWRFVKENTDEDIPLYLWDKMKDSLIGMDENNNPVPDNTLLDGQKLGISVRPRQSMFKDMYEARRNFVDIVNEVFASRDISKQLDINTELFEEVFQAEQRPSVEYSYTVEKVSQLDLIRDKELIGKNILVENDETHDGIWTIWEMIDIHVFKMVEYQKYNMSKFINYIDLYRDELVQFTIPNYTLKSELELKNLINSNRLKNGMVVLIDDGKQWILKEYQDKSFYTVGLQNATIQLNDMLYSFEKDKDNLDSDFWIGDGKTKYQYLMEESTIILKKIIYYFESN